MNDLPETAELYLDGSRGQYIPQNFFEITKPECINWTCDKEQKAWILDQCSDPNNEHYWDAWNSAETDIPVTNPETNVVYQLHQDGDLWIVPVDAEWPDND